MAKYQIETYYTCSFKVTHYLENVNEKELYRNRNEIDAINILFPNFIFF